MKKNSLFFCLHALGQPLAQCMQTYRACSLKQAYPWHVGLAFLLSMPIVLGSIWYCPALLPAKAVKSMPSSIVCMCAFPILSYSKVVPMAPPKRLPLYWRKSASIQKFARPLVGPDDITWESGLEDLPRWMQRRLQIKQLDTALCDVLAKIDTLPDSLGMVIPALPEKHLSPDSTFPDLIDPLMPPSFPGGERALLEYLRENMPSQKRPCDVSVVAVTFVIERDGSVTNPQVIRGGGDCGQAALCLVENMPKWKPGEFYGQAMPVRYTLPIRIHIE